MKQGEFLDLMKLAQSLKDADSRGNAQSIVLQIKLDEANVERCLRQRHQASIKGDVARMQRLTAAMFDYQSPPYGASALNAVYLRKQLRYELDSAPFGRRAGLGSDLDFNDLDNAGDAYASELAVMVELTESDYQAWIDSDDDSYVEGDYDLSLEFSAAEMPF